VILSVSRWVGVKNTTKNKSTKGGVNFLNQKHRPEKKFFFLIVFVVFLVVSRYPGIDKGSSKTAYKYFAKEICCPGTFFASELRGTNQPRQGPSFFFSRGRGAGCFAWSVLRALSALCDRDPVGYIESRWCQSGIIKPRADLDALGDAVSTAPNTNSQRPAAIEWRTVTRTKRRI
jgi:hypothetical protein